MRNEGSLRADIISLWLKLFSDKSRTSRFLNDEHKSTRNWIHSVLHFKYMHLPRNNHELIPPLKQHALALLINNEMDKWSYLEYEDLSPNQYKPDLVPSKMWIPRGMAGCHLSMGCHLCQGPLDYATLMTEFQKLT